MRFLLPLLIFIQVYAYVDTLSPVKSLYYDREKALLGKKLFYDTRLSPSGTVSCEVCHNLYWDMTGTTGVSTSDQNLSIVQIIKDAKINPPTVLNAAFNYLFFIDGRSRDMKDQIKISITDENQLASSKEFILSKIETNPDYMEKFKLLYKNGLRFENVIDALMHFQNALITPKSKFDSYIQGYKDAFSEDEKKGFQVFQNAGCVICHNGINLGGNVFYNKDLDSNKTMYERVPGLRNVARTAPYFRNGSVNNLKEAINHVPSVIDIKEDDVELLYKFLQTLNGEKPDILR